MKRFIVAIIAWVAVSKATSAALRYRVALRNADAPAMVKQADRLGSALGLMSFFGVLAAPFFKKKYERMHNAMKGMGDK